MNMESSSTFTTSPTKTAKFGLGRNRGSIQIDDSLVS